MTSAASTEEDEDLDSESGVSDEEDERVELRGKIQRDIDKRQPWELRQTTWYTMVHDGLRRRNLPWPWASDLHFPLIDGVIDKKKPFYFNQLFGTDTIAQFVPYPTESQTEQASASEVGAWFDWKLKQRSNLEIEMLIGIDMMLTTGEVPVAVRWDPAKKCLAFDAIEPLHLIVPEWTKDLQEADRVTIVHHLSEEQYLRDPNFTEKDKDFLTRIKGSGQTEQAGDTTYKWTKDIREGITGSEMADLIVVWEIWEQVGADEEQDQDAAPSETDGKPRWRVHWMSPVVPETPLRKSQMNPFKHGMLPIVRFDREIKEKGNYASRGVPEKLAPFETAITKQWNEKVDYMSLCNRPLFTSQNPIPNAGNIRMIPGTFVAGGISAVQMPQPPVSFDQEMQSTRATAENLIGMPDNGLTEQAEGGPNDSRTATEIKQIGGLQGIQTEMNGRIFRIRMADLLRLAWSTLCQYDKDTTYFLNNTAKSLPKATPITPEDWLLVPNGSSESWNKPAMLQKSVQRFQMFKGNPLVNQVELVKSVLELDDPRLVQRLVQDPNVKAQSDYNEEMSLMPALMLGIVLQVTPEDDQVARIRAVMDFIKGMHQFGTPVPQQAIKAIATRMQQHVQSLQAVDPKQAHMALAAWQQTLKQFPPVVMPSGAQGQAPQAPAEKPKTLAESIQWKPDDLTPDERAQVLGEAGIRASSSQEVIQWQIHKANLSVQQKDAVQHSKANADIRVEHTKAALTPPEPPQENAA